MPNNLSTYCKLLVVSRIGGGKSRGKNYSLNACASRVDDGCCVTSDYCSRKFFISDYCSRKFFAADYCSRKGSRRLFLCLLVCALALVCTSCHRGATVCGVPYSGATPWQLAAAIHDDSDGSFMPVSVNEYSDKAYINGFLLPDEIPAHIVCDVQDGEVTHAILYNSIVDNE